MSTVAAPEPNIYRPAIAFIGGGNMASAILGGLLKKGVAAEQIEMVEPVEAARARLREQFGVVARPEAGPALARCALVVWAVKPQSFADAARPVRPHTAGALHLSVAAGIRSAQIAQWAGTERVVRAMPNTPALVGQGITGLFPRAAVSSADRAQIEAVLAPTGTLLWLEDEAQLDAVTALSGSGPAYVFYFLEAMERAGVEMGLAPAQARQLAQATFAGATALAAASDDPPQMLRERVTSKGGTTHAAVSILDEAGVQAAFVRAMHSARERAQALGDEFGSA